MKSLKHHWQDKGYIIVRSVLERDRAEQLRPICDDILDQWRSCSAETGEPGGGPEATVMRHLNHPGYFKEHPEWYSALMNAVADEKVIGVAKTLFEEEPLFRCTSYFFNPLENSRDGNWHRDTQFRTDSDEEEKEKIFDCPVVGNGIQMQVALAPSDDVEFVPGSHIRWDTPQEYQIRKADGEENNKSNNMPGAIRIALESGDAVLFNACGLHRGRYHTDKVRRTLMLTYTRSSYHVDDYFSQQPWFLNDVNLDSLNPQVKEFFQRFVDEYSADWKKTS